MSNSQPTSRYYYLKSHSKLKSERALLKMHTKMKEEKLRLQWETTKELVSLENIRQLIDDKLQSLRNISGIFSTAISTIMSLIAGRHRRGCR